MESAFPHGRRARAGAVAAVLAVPNAMFVKNEYRLQRVAFDDILYIEGT
jgi:hypothetical protein